MVYGCSKIFLSLLNSLLIIFGIAWIELSFYVYNKYHSVQFIISVIILALFVIFIGVLGLIGALNRSKCGKNMFLYLTIIILYIFFKALSIYILLIGLITLVLCTLLIVLRVKRNWLINQVIDNYEQFVTNSKLLDDEKNLHATRDL